jgi:hypothetical protein
MASGTKRWGWHGPLSAHSCFAKSTLSANCQIAVEASTGGQQCQQLQHCRQGSLDVSCPNIEHAKLRKATDKLGIYKHIYVYEQRSKSAYECTTPIEQQQTACAQFE